MVKGEEGDQWRKFDSAEKIGLVQKRKRMVRGSTLLRETCRMVLKKQEYQGQ